MGSCSSSRVPPYWQERGVCLGRPQKGATWKLRAETLAIHSRGEWSSVWDMTRGKLCLVGSMDAGISILNNASEVCDVAFRNREKMSAKNPDFRVFCV